MPNEEKSLIKKEDSNPTSLIAQAIQNNVPVETMEKLLSLQERWEKNQAKKAFDAAMAEFQSKCPVIEKTKKVFEKGSTTKARYSYAPLDSIVSQVKKHLAKNGLSYTFEEIKDDKFTEIVCVVTHIQGHSQRTSFKIPIGEEAYMTDVQKYGARMTFGKRYAFCNAFGIMTSDEDIDADVNDSKKDTTNYVDKLKMALSKKGAKNLQEALEIYSNLTGESIKAMPTDNTKAKKMFESLTNSPAFNQE